jgi:hypothetical protein
VGNADRLESRAPYRQVSGSQRVRSSVLRVADLGRGWLGEPISWHGTCVHVPSAVCCRALQADDDEADGSLAFGASDFLASAGAVSAVRTAIELAKIACLIRMEGSPLFEAE